MPGSARRPPHQNQRSSERGYVFRFAPIATDARTSRIGRFQVVIEDYVYSGTKFATLVTVRLGCCALGVAGIAASLSIAFGS
jgi:hypothetical protein